MLGKPLERLREGERKEDVIYKNSQDNRGDR